MARFLRNCIVLVCCLSFLVTARQSQAQRVRFPSAPPPVQTQPANTIPQLPNGISPYSNSIPPYSGSTTQFPQIPNYGSPTIAPPLNTAPSATISPPNFDGFATQPGFTYPPPPSYPGQPPTGFSGSVQPMIAPPAGTTGAPAYPQSPPYLFPNLTLPAISGPSTWFDGWSWPGSSSGSAQPSGSRDWLGRSFWSKFEKGPYLSLFQEFRVGQTYLAGNDGTELQMNDTELGTTLNYPNFFFSGEPLRVSPGFILHLWDGPVSPSADLPARAYSSFLAFDFSNSAQQQFGVDLNFSLGLYTDFNGLTSDAFRFKGAGLGRVRLAPDLTFRFGVVYWDRLEVTLLPAVGFFWTPTPDARMEIFFPYPKLARRFPQVGNSDVWGYIRGEYGGDTFSIERTTGPGAGLHDQVDIIDYRILVGTEWTTLKGATGFFEGGYVFGRELAYRHFPGDNTDIDSTFMFRTGFSF